MLKSKKLIRILAFVLSICLAFGNLSVFAEVDASSVIGEDVLTDEEAVRADLNKLNLGFTLCVSRDLPFIKEGENGSKITWESERPDIISNEGKFTAPIEVTKFSVKATVSKGDVSASKSFTLTANDRTMLDVVMDYVHTMLEYGRDDHYFTPEEYRNAKLVPIMTNKTNKNIHNEKSGLFFGLIDRDTLKYPAFYVTDWPRTSHATDERGSGCETTPEMWLYEILYALTAMTGDEEYAKVADENFQFFLKNCMQQSSGVLAWGKHTLYDPVAGLINAPNQYATSAKEQEAWTAYQESGAGDKYAYQSPFFMNKFFEIDFDATHQHMLSWYSAALADKKDFTFSRHVMVDGSGNASGNYLSQLNPMAFAYAWGYHYTGDPQFTEALHSMMNWIEKWSGMNENYCFPQELTYPSNRFRQSWMSNAMSVTNWFYQLAPLVPEDIRERMIKYADRITEEFPKYNPSNGKESFSQYVSLRDGYTDTWSSLPAYYISIWQRLPEGEEKAKFEGWILDWCEKYNFDDLNDYLNQVDFTPDSIASLITRNLSIYEETKDKRYLDRALEICDFCIYAFWELESLLPSMTYAQKKYYESTWGSVQVVKGIWDSYYEDVEYKTGVNPVDEAWEKAGYVTRNIYDLANDPEFLERTKFNHEAKRLHSAKAYNAEFEEYDLNAR